MSTEQDLIYDGHAVYQGMTDQARLRTGPDNVSDVLDSLHRLTKAARQQAVSSGYVMVPKTATREIEDVIGRSRSLKASEIWEDALSAAPQAEHMLSAAPAPAERVEQEPDMQDKLKVAYWDFDARVKGIAPYAAPCGQPEHAFVVSVLSVLDITPQPSPAPAAPDVAGLSQAATDLLAERQRQISAEGWTPAHDDEHRDGEMANAAACYALNAAVPMRGLLPPYWPWDRHWWKPSSSRRDLIKAGALILAEIERLDRAALAAHQNREG